MSFDMCRMCLLGVLLIVDVSAIVPEESSPTKKPSYYCESHDSDGRLVIVDRDPIYITSAGYYRKDTPGYSSFQNCRWQLQTTTGLTLSLDVIDLDLQKNTNCSNDFIIIRNEKHLVSRLCGLPGESRIFHFSDTKMTVEFHTDARNNSRGFKLKVYTLRSSLQISLMVAGCLVLVLCIPPAVCLLLAWECSKKSENKYKENKKEPIISVEVLDIDQKIP